VRDAVNIELAGVPTIILGHTTFAGAAKVHSKALGLPDAPMLMLEPPPAGVVGDDVEATDEEMAAIVTALTKGEGP
jgi:hypothetical protein